MMLEILGRILSLPESAKSEVGMFSVHKEVAVVDDDPTVRQFLIEVLELNYSIKVISFENGLDAWHHMDKKPEGIDIVITDINMPKMNGMELLMKINTRFPEKKVIVISGYPANEGLIEGMGAYAFLPKPFKLSSLVRLVGSCLSQQKDPESWIASEPALARSSFAVQ